MLSLPTRLARSSTHPRPLLAWMAIWALSAGAWALEPLQGSESAPPAPKPQGLAIVGATIHSLVPGRAPEVGTLLIVGDRIQGQVAEATLSPDLPRLDGRGKHLVPGLIDGMVNFDPGHDALYLAYGITLVRDMGGDAGQVIALRDPAFRDQGPGPALLTAGAVLDGDPPLSSAAVTVTDEAKLSDAIGALADSYQVDFLSVQPNFPLALLGPLRRLAKEHQLDVWGLMPRGSSLDQLTGWRGLLGLDVLLPSGVQWSFVQPGAFGPLIEQLVSAGLALVPVVGEARRRITRPNPDNGDFDLLDAYYESEWSQEWSVREGLFDERFQATGQRIDQKRKDLLVKLIGHGVQLLPGSGAPASWLLPGRSLHEELAAWVAAGIPPADVLARATRDAAKLLGQGDQRGRIEPGLIADLLLVDEDPTLDLSSLAHPRAVVVRGRALTREQLDQRLEELKTLQREQRARDAQPIEIKALALPEGDPLLAGQVETRYLTRRLSAERYAVVSTADGTLDVLTRLVIPDSGDFRGNSSETAQRIVGGDLQGFSVRLVTGGDELILRGVRTGGSLRLERKFNGSTISTQVAEELPSLLVLSPLSDTIATALVLGQRREVGSLVVLQLADQLEPVLDRWLVQDAPDGTRWVKNQQGWMRFTYGADGQPLEVLRTTGRQQVQTVLSKDSATNFGGAGLPVRFVAPAESVGPPAPEGEPQ